MVRRLLAMPLLPAEHIPQAFQHQREKAANNDRMLELFNYVHDTWVEGSMWTPTDWSVYGQSVRTNNNCEGWHRRLNLKAVAAPPFYVLVENDVTSGGAVRQQQGEAHKREKAAEDTEEGHKIHAAIFSEWRAYEQGGVSTYRLLKNLSGVYSK